MSRRQVLGVLAGALILAAGAFATAVEPEGRGCLEASVTTALISATHTDGQLYVKGLFTASGNAVGALVECRVDSDRYSAETRQGREGALESVFPFALCGDHVARFSVFPLVAEGDRQVVCLERSAQAKAEFNVPCGAEIKFGRCQWQCDDAGSCTGSCVATVQGEGGDFLVVASVAQAPFRTVGPAGPGPFSVALSCRSGEKIRLRARTLRARSYTGAAEHVCGEP